MASRLCALAALLVSAAVLVLAPPTANAAIYGGPVCAPDGSYVYLRSGGDCTHGRYHGDHRYIENKSSPWSGLSGVYLVNSSGTRITANTYCNQPGCTAYRNFCCDVGGFHNSHNHGGYGSNFQGYINYSA